MLGASVWGEPVTSSAPSSSASASVSDSAYGYGYAYATGDASQALGYSLPLMFFGSFVLVVSYVMLNLFLGVITFAMEAEQQRRRI